MIFSEEQNMIAFFTVPIIFQEPTEERTVIYYRFTHFTAFSAGMWLICIGFWKYSLKTWHSNLFKTLLKIKPRKVPVLLLNSSVSANNLLF